MNPSISFVLQLPPSTAYAKLESVAQNLLSGMSKMLDSGKVRFSIFMDGPTLVAAQKVARPLMFGRFRKAIEDGYLEVLGGGFYDPMLPLFPTELQSMQLAEHRAFLWKHFGVEPSGYFNSSMVWEMEMTELLEKNHFEYALVQESALQDALGRSTSVSGWYSVEDKGSFMRVVPVSESLSKAIADDDLKWREIAGLYCRGRKTAVVAMDIPPQPGDIVPFFERLIDFIEANDVQTKTVSGVINEQASEGRLSFLLSAGRKIGLPAAAKTCRELLIKRPEVNLLHKSLLSLFRRGESSLKDKARREFFMKLLPAMSPIYYRDMQDCEGMRSPMVRLWGCRFLLQAARSLAEGISFDGIRLEIADFMLEGRKLIWAENHDYSFLMDYSDGGILRILNMTTSENSILGSWRDDGKPAVGFLDFVLPNTELPATKLEQLLVDREGCLREPYDYQIKRHDAGSDILLSAEQHFNLGEQHCVFHVQKDFALSSAGSDFVLEYKVSNNGFDPVKGFFGSLLESGLLACDKSGKGFSVDGSPLSFDFKEPLIYPEAKTLDIVDRYTSCHVHLKFDTPAALFVAPSFSASAAAAPEEIQGVKVFPFWKISLKSLEDRTFKISVRFSKR